MPTVAEMAGGPISSVVPSTTATALTSIATGLTPGRHGVVGYRMSVDARVLNVLRWATPEGDARKAIPPHMIQPEPSFLSQRAPVVTRADFERSGFSAAHLADCRFTPYRVPSTMVTEVARLLRAGEPFVYTYYEGIDKVAHEYGLGEHYDVELRFADQLVSELISVLPRGATLLITADHGQLETGDNIVDPHPDVLSHTSWQSGEGRFRWFHARPGREAALQEACLEHHGSQAWVRTQDEVVKEGWFGPVVTDAAASRLGDVAMAAKGTVAFNDPADTGPYHLIGRHGSLTSAEMRVPLLAAGH
jgi:predicted AlkP superfamily pyrophosphatase or phosphodiesterase